MSSSSASDSDYDIRAQTKHPLPNLLQEIKPGHDFIEMELFSAFYMVSQYVRERTLLESCLRMIAYDAPHGQSQLDAEISKREDNERRAFNSLSVYWPSTTQLMEEQNQKEGSSDLVSNLDVVFSSPSARTEFVGNANAIGKFVSQRTFLDTVRSEDETLGLFFLKTNTKDPYLADLFEHERNEFWHFHDYCTWATKTEIE
jgi:hypothetical protein